MWLTFLSLRSFSPRSPLLQRERERERGWVERMKDKEKRGGREGERGGEDEG